jgi:hypothetical protein
MRYFILSVFFLLSTNLASAATGETTIFPPANCNDQEQRIITWQDGAPTTNCAAPQDVLQMALPSCAEGDTIVFTGGKFSCASGQVPTAASRTTADFDASGHCCAPPAPHCCTTPSLITTVVTCTLQYTGPAENSWGCTATCPEGYTVTGGGFDAPAAYTTGGHYSRPSGNGWISDIGAVDHCTTGTPPCQSSAGYAICAKIVATGD